ncbi:MAG TPA: methylated-DNA--[protein]-cysteine S-methyltransferase [Candidatus Saccharimonadales bacterium]|nr:methylated-DNA--[protein]-cysteine S-methyltransferase [Candidatus Saccharimonadales bacterium]
MIRLHLITTHTPDGPFYMIADEQDVVRVSGFGAVSDLEARLPAASADHILEALEAHPYQRHILDYYAGVPNALDAILRAQIGSPFQEKVWSAISAIPYGKTMTYKQLAQAAGNPAAVRAAGTICGRNRLILLVPCHRVLKSDGSIGSYLYGPTLKKSLLDRERS